MIRIASVNPDLYCREDHHANVGGPFCGRCGRGIMLPAGQGDALAWCYGCGFDHGSLPLVEVPIGWSDFADAITFDEARRLADPHFDPLVDFDERRAR